MNLHRPHGIDADQGRPGDSPSRASRDSGRGRIPGRGGQQRAAAQRWMLAATHRKSRAVMTEQPGPPSAAELIVDDEHDIHEVLLDCVRDEGYDVEHAWSGPDVQAHNQKATFSAAIFHVRVPDPDSCICAWSCVNDTLSRRSSYAPASWMCGSTGSIPAPLPLSSNLTQGLSCKRVFVEQQGGRRECDRHGDRRLH